MASRILVVDDSSAARAYVRAAIESNLDAEVDEATGGFEALRILPRARYDLVIVDVNMPNINGLELISFMRSSDLHRETPLLVSSTEASERDRDRARELGANGYLEKPFSSDQLLAAVAALDAVAPGSA